MAVKFSHANTKKKKNEKKMVYTVKSYMMYSQILGLHCKE